MAVTTGNFQDLVQLSQDTLYHLGPMFQVGNSAASTVTFGMSNSGGQLALVGSQTANATVWLPTSGTLLSNINISAGTTSSNVSAVTFSNANNVSFGFDGTNVTASFNADAQAIGGIAAGTQTATTGTVVFSNSNNVTFGMSNSSVITASVTVASTQASINFSGGTTSNNLSAITFSNSNGVSFGLNGSTMTASVATSLTNINVSAGTTSNNLSAITFSNSNNVSFGLNASTITGSFAFNVSAGTTSNNLSAITFSNSNGISFGLNASTITAALGGMSSWSNGGPVTALSHGEKTLYFQPLIVPYLISVTNIAWLASATAAATNSSGGYSLSAALYTLNAGASYSLLSSASTNVTFTSGAALSIYTGINYHSLSVATWVITPGAYLFGWWISTQNSASLSYYGPAAQPAISSGRQASLSAYGVNGYSQATVAAMPSSFGITNTASYIRTGATAANQPWILFQGT